MEQEPQQGIVRSVIDSGTVVQVSVEMSDGRLRWLAADGNMFRRAQAALGIASLCALRIQFEVSNWGGLTWFAIVPDEHVPCLDCGRNIPPHLDPDFCIFGLHRRKTPSPANGVHHE